MFWDLSLDDMYGDFCGEGPFPLISELKTCGAGGPTDEPVTASTNEPGTLF